MKEKTPTYHIFVGLDERQKEAFQVCKHSLETNVKTVNIKVHALHHRDLREKGLFTREWKVDKDGQYIDLVDGRPFSTQFTFTRFLIADLWRSMPDTDKSDLVMFVDCDWVFLDDIGEMFEDIERQRLLTGGRSPVYCVHHDYKPKAHLKMDNMQQFKYNMKLWAALMVLDMSHKDNEGLTAELTNTAGGRDLMNFCWVKNLNTLGQIDEAWHFLPDHSEKNEVGPIKGIHLTEGGPWFLHMRNGRYDGLWWKYYNSFLTSQVYSLSMNMENIIDA